MTMVVVYAFDFEKEREEFEVEKMKHNIVTLTFVATHLHNEPIDKCTFCFDVSVL